MITALTFLFINIFLELQMNSMKAIIVAKKSPAISTTNTPLKNKCYQTNIETILSQKKKINLAKEHIVL